MQTYLVGGAVRDALLNIPVKDKDYVVVGSSVDEMLALGFQQVGRDFPVFLHPDTKQEYALARAERKSGLGYTGFECDSSSEVSLEQDLLRRDLTINAIAQDQDGNLYDPYGGQKDLKKRVLRHVSPAFQEDPLRLLRVARFAARFAHLGFSIAPETLELMRTISSKGELNYLSAERVWLETQRAMATRHPEVFFQVLNQVSALSPWFEELSTITLPDEHHQLVINHSNQDAQAAVAFARVVLPLESQQIRRLCERLRCPNEVTALAICSADSRASLLHATELPTPELLDTLNRVDVWRKPERFQLILDVLFDQRDSAQQELKTRLIELVDTAKQIDAKRLVAQGLSGLQIKHAIQQQRLDIFSVLSAPTKN